MNIKKNWQFILVFIMAVIAFPVIAVNAVTAGVVQPIPQNGFGSDLAERIMIPFISSLLGGGVVVALFRNAVDNSLQKSDKLKILVNAMVNEHPTIKALQQENHEIAGMIKATSQLVEQTKTELHSVDLKVAGLMGGIEQIKDLIRRST